MRLRALVLRSLLWVVLALIASAELAIVQWARLASGAPALGFGLATGVFLTLLVVNAAWLILLRRFRVIRASPLLGRTYLVGSVGAMGCGLLLGLVWAALGLLDAVNPWASELWPRYGVIAGGSALAAGAAALLYSVSFGQRRVAVERVALRMPQLPDELHGLCIAHITDLHIGPNLRAARLRRFVERVNAMEPDLIAITGDIFDFDPAFIEEGCRELAGLRARHGVYAILGNHDVYTGVERVAEGIARHTSIRLLRDEWHVLEIGANRLYVVGIEDPGHGLSDHGISSDALDIFARELPEGAHRILLVHRPNYFPQIARLGFPVALAGHTHGGQVSLPAPVHHHNIARLATPWTRGLFRSGDTQLYVNRGLGVAGIPVRFNCPREIALLTLETA